MLKKLSGIYNGDDFCNGCIDKIQGVGLGIYAMKILHILDHSIPLHSGYTFRTAAIIRQQRELGWETCHITSPKHYLDSPLEEDVAGLHFFRTPAVPKWASKLPIINQLAIIPILSRRLDDVVAKEKPDILHAHSPALNGIAAINVGRSHGIPVVYEVRAFWEDAAADHGTSKEWGVRYRLTRALETYVLKRANAVTTICEGLRSDIVARKVPEKRVTVIPNAVDTERFLFDGSADTTLLKELGLEGKDVLGFIGSFYAYEGLPLLVEAMPRILKYSPNVRLLFVGGGPQEEILREVAEKNNVSDKVIFTGRVPHDQVQRYYDLVDIFVYPRLSMRLTDLVTPLKPLEAMAQGRIVLASDVGGHKELIQHHENGYLFSAGSVEALADGVIDLLCSREKWPQLRETARKFVEQERSWPASVSRYRDVYASVMTG